MKTYNGILIPDTIQVNKISSAFENFIDDKKIEEYTSIMRENDYKNGHNGFPPIKGYPTIFDKDDLENEDFTLMNFETNLPELGDLIWKVTDGHHRVLAAINADIYQLEIELDYSCITKEEEL